MTKKPFPCLGVGIGLRPIHYREIIAQQPAIDWFEIISENYMVPGGKPLFYLEQIQDRYPIVQHGVALAIGSPAPLDWEYLTKLKALTKRTKTPWLSDHLCWGRLPGAHYHDLLPLPYTREVIAYVAERARIVQDFLEIPFALENLSSYVSFVEDEMPEWEFYSGIIDKAGVYMMLDVNNIYVSSRNHGFSCRDYCRNLPFDKIIQIHIAGHSDRGDYVLDTHDDYVCKDVWEIYEEVWPKTGGVSTLLEWDDDFIPFNETWAEALKAKAIQERLLASMLVEVS